MDKGCCGNCTCGQETNCGGLGLLLAQPIFENDKVKIYWDKEDLRLFVFGDGWEFNIGRPFGSVLAGFGWTLCRFPSDYTLEVWLGPFALEMEWSRV